MWAENSSSNFISSMLRGFREMWGYENATITKREPEPPKPLVANDPPETLRDWIIGYVNAQVRIRELHDACVQASEDDEDLAFSVLYACWMHANDSKSESTEGLRRKLRALVDVSEARMEV